MDQLDVRRCRPDQLGDRCDVAAKLKFSIAQPILRIKQLRGQDEGAGAESDQGVRHKMMICDTLLWRCAEQHSQGSGEPL
jgi:hypothetical protein